MTESAFGVEHVEISKLGMPKLPSFGAMKTGAQNLHAGATKKIGNFGANQQAKAYGTAQNAITPGASRRAGVQGKVGGFLNRNAKKITTGALIGTGGVAAGAAGTYGTQKLRKNYVSKAEQEKASLGRRATAQLTAGVHPFVAAKEGKKLRAGGRQFAEATGGAAGGAVLGTLGASALQVARMKKMPIGAVARTGASLGGIAGVQHAVTSNQRKGYYKPQKVRKSAFGVEHVAKAAKSDPKNGPSGGRYITGGLWPGIHGAVAGQPGHKLKAAGTEFGGAMVGSTLVPGVGALPGAVLGTHYAHKQGWYKANAANPNKRKKAPAKKKKAVAKSAFGIEHVSKAKSEKGLLGNGRSDGSNALLHRGRGSNSKLLHDGRGNGKVLLHDGKAKGRLIKTLGDGRATIDTKLGAK